MALAKEVQTEFGASVKATYWRLGEVHDVIVDQKLTAVFFGYASEADRRANARPLVGVRVEIPTQVYTAFMSPSAVYAFSKTDGQPFFGASDV